MYTSYIILLYLYINKQTQKPETMKTTKSQIEELAQEVKVSLTATTEGRKTVADNCKKLYDTIEEGLYEKYGEEAVNDAYFDLCKGNFAEPYMCEQKISKFTLYSTIFINNIA